MDNKNYILEVSKIENRLKYERIKMTPLQELAKEIDNIMMMLAKDLGILKLLDWLVSKMQR